MKRELILKNDYVMGDTKKGEKVYNIHPITPVTRSGFIYTPIIIVSKEAVDLECVLKICSKCLVKTKCMDQLYIQLRRNYGTRMSWNWDAFAVSVNPCDRMKNCLIENNIHNYEFEAIYKKKWKTT
jgi:hypothetical protein